MKGISGKARRLRRIRAELVELASEFTVESTRQSMFGQPAAREVARQLAWASAKGIDKALEVIDSELALSRRAREAGPIKYKERLRCPQES